MEELSEIKPSNHDIIWIATARLHIRNRENRAVFTIPEITNEVKSLGLNVSPQTINQYISSHCVANTRASPDNHCYLYRVDTGKYRLYRPGDFVYTSRKYGKEVPEAETMPKRFRELLDWYNNEYCKQKTKEFETLSPKVESPPYERIDDNGKISMPHKIKEWLKLSHGDHVSFVTMPNGRIQLQKVKVALQLQ